jgi:hypothetical protein
LVATWIPTKNGGEKMENKNELTIAEALRELKLIDNLLTKRRANIARYCSKKKNSIDEIEKQKAFVKEQFQSARDLLTRYKDIKLAIQKANLDSTFTFNKQEYTISEALLYKQYLKEQYELLYNSFTPRNAQTQLQALQLRGAVQLTEEELKAANLVPELYYDERKIQIYKEDLLTFMAMIDALIDKTNHATTIVL